MRSLLILAVLLATASLSAQSAPGSPLINYDGYTSLTSEVAPHRKARLISLAEFNQRAAAAGTLILDARSEQAFSEGHIKGAINLPLPDFTAEALAKVIGDNPNREILIYCNNNFRDNVRPVVTKRVELALNIQTFINLYGYGYRNVFELGEAVSMDAPEVGWVSAPT
jgi:hypothetical protein